MVRTFLRLQFRRIGTQQSRFVPLRSHRTRGGSFTRSIHLDFKDERSNLQLIAIIETPLVYYAHPIDQCAVTAAQVADEDPFRSDAQ